MLEIAHLLLEGLGAALLFLFGWLLKVAYESIKELRKDLQVEKDKREAETVKRAELELRIERDFVKHEDLEWIRDTLEKLDRGQRAMVDSINQLRVDMARPANWRGAAE